MMLRSLSVCLLSLLMATAPLRASEIKPVEVRPGAVATLVVSLPARAVASSQASARFTIQPAEGVRILGATTGILPWNGEGERRFPIAFSVDAGAPAGEMTAGQVRVEWPDGQVVRTELRMRVGVVRKLSLEALASRPVLKPGQSVRITYRVTNRGNAADTIHLEALAGTSWKVAPASESRLVPVGGTVDGYFEVTAPRTAPLGEQRLIVVRALGRGGEEKVSVLLLVAEDDASLFGLAQIPATVFFGGSTAGGYNIAFSGRGSIGPETEVGVAFRRIDSYNGQVFGQTDLWGPRALLSVRHRGVQAEMGEVSLRNDGIMSRTYATGRGLHARAKKGDLSAAVFAARPFSSGKAADGGLLLHAELGYDLPVGSLSAQVSDLNWGSTGGLTTRRAQTAALRYSLAERGPHRLLAEAGITRESSGSGAAAQSVALDAGYSYSTSDASFSAQLKRSPEMLAGRLVATNEAMAHGSLAVADAIRVHGSAFWNERPGMEGSTGIGSAGASAGVSLSGLGSSLGISAGRRISEGSFVIGGAETRTTISGSLSTGMGPLALRANAEVGEAVVGEADAHEVRRLQGQLRWSRPSKNVWVGINYADERLFSSPLQAEFGADLRLGELNVKAAAGTNLTGAGLEGAYLRAGVEAYVTSTLSVVAGAEHSSSMLSTNPTPWTFSVGFRKALPLPLPLKDAPKVSGVVFNDRNGNGQQDRGEPGVSGVGVSIGSLRTTTDADGRFGFRSGVTTGLPVRLEIGTLKQGFLALFTETLVSNRKIEMPVVEAASLDLQVFEDANGDEKMDVTEAALAGVAIEVRSSMGRAYPGVTDAKGRLSFGTVPPGEYTVMVVRKDQEPTSLELQLSPGESLSQPVAVRPSARTVKWRKADTSQER